MDLQYYSKLWTLSITVTVTIQYSEEWYRQDRSDFQCGTLDSKYQAQQFRSSPHYLA